jgi:Bacterial SH3 domain
MHLPTLASLLCFASLLSRPAQAQDNPALPVGVTSAGGTAWVLADSLRVRLAPAPGAGVVAGLRIGTALEVKELRAGADGSWARVSLIDPFNTVEGWVAADLLTTTAPSTLLLHAEVLAATTVDERAVWVERALAFDPYSPVARQHLDALREQQGRPAPAEKDPSVWLATCQDGRAVLTGRVNASGRVHSGPVDPGTLAELARRPWYAADAAEPVPGTPFPRPFQVGRHGEQDGSVIAEGTYPMGIDVELVPVLGPCPVLATLTTAPTRHVSTAPTQVEVPDPRAGQLLSAHSVALEGGGGFVSHSLAVPYKLYDCGGEGQLVEAGVLMLTDARGDISLALGGPLPSSGFASYEPAEWLDLGGSRRVGLSAGLSGTSGGVTLVGLSTGGVLNVAHTTISSWGC